MFVLILATLTFLSVAADADESLVSLKITSIYRYSGPIQQIGGRGEPTESILIILAEEYFRADRVDGAQGNIPPSYERTLMLSHPDSDGDVCIHDVCVSGLVECIPERCYRTAKQDRWTVFLPQNPLSEKSAEVGITCERERVLYFQMVEMERVDILSEAKAFEDTRQ